MEAMDLEPRIRQHESSLRARHPGVAGCRVSIEERSPRAYERKRFNVRLDMVFAGRDIVINREHDADAGAALGEAFEAAAGQLLALEQADL
jgi:hypothetical protein